MGYKIEDKILLREKKALDKTLFEGSELKPYAKTSFKCCNCDTHNELKITPYQTGFPFSQLHKNSLLSEKQILTNRVAAISNKTEKHLGDYLVDNLPTLYFGVDCKKCAEKHIVFFGFGEKQPGRWMLKISGVWNF